MGGVVIGGDVSATTKIASAGWRRRVARWRVALAGQRRRVALLLDWEARLVASEAVSALCDEKVRRRDCVGGLLRWNWEAGLVASDAVSVR